MKISSSSRTTANSAAAAEYRPTEGIARCHWPGRTWAQSLGRPEPGSIQVQLGGS
jgi:hypothetical protein